MQQFTLQRLFGAVFFVALAATIQIHFFSILSCYLSASLVGAGIFSLVGRPLLGAMIGLLGQSIVLVGLRLFFHASLPW
jgi:hypothetical protein